MIANRFGVPELNLFLFANRASGGLKKTNRSFEAIRANRWHVMKIGLKFRRAQSTPDPDTFEKYRDTPPISIAILLQKYALFWQKVVYTPPICITIRLPFVSRYFCESIRVRGRWNTRKFFGVLQFQQEGGVIEGAQKPETCRFAE